MRIETTKTDQGALIVVEGEIDLGGVTYMDSSGVATLVEGLRSAKEHQKAFTLIAPSTAVMKVLELARLDSIFEVRPA